MDRWPLHSLLAILRLDTHGTIATLAHALRAMAAVGQRGPYTWQDPWEAGLDWIQASARFEAWFGVPPPTPFIRLRTNVWQVPRPRPAECGCGCRRDAQVCTCAHMCALCTVRADLRTYHHRHARRGPAAPVCELVMTVTSAHRGARTPVCSALPRNPSPGNWACAGIPAGGTAFTPVLPLPAILLSCCILGRHRHTHMYGPARLSVMSAGCRLRQR